MLKICCIFILFMYFGRRSFEFIGYNLQIICLISQSLWWILYAWWILSQNGHVQSFLAVQGNCPGCAGLPPITRRDLVGTLAIIIIIITITIMIITWCGRRERRRGWRWSGRGWRGSGRRRRSGWGPARRAASWYFSLVLRQTYHDQLWGSWNNWNRISVNICCHKK